MNSNTSANKASFRTHKSYSAEEMLAAGGATAFGVKTNRNNQSLIKALENAAPAEPFSKEEWDNSTDDLKEDK